MAEGQIPAYITCDRFVSKYELINIAQCILLRRIRSALLLTTIYIIILEIDLRNVSQDVSDISLGGCNLYTSRVTFF